MNKRFCDARPAGRRGRPPDGLVHRVDHGVDECAPAARRCRSTSLAFCFSTGSPKTRTGYVDIVLRLGRDRMTSGNVPEGPPHSTRTGHSYRRAELAEHADEVHRRVRGGLARRVGDRGERAGVRERAEALVEVPAHRRARGRCRRRCPRTARCRTASADPGAWPATSPSTDERHVPPPVARRGEPQRRPRATPSGIGPPRRRESCGRGRRCARSTSSPSSTYSDVARALVAVGDEHALVAGAVVELDRSR